MKEINDKLDAIAGIIDHYLVKARAERHHNYDEFMRVAAILKTLLTDKEYEFWCAEKMLLKQQAFAEKTFIQYAVETSVVRFFGERYPTNFKVEAKINPGNDKDVDCRFENSGYTYNVEVKCSDFVSKETIDKKEEVKYVTIGRLPDRGEETIKVISLALDEGFEKKGEAKKEHLRAKNMDNNLKEFLELAHEKFSPVAQENEVNVLIVGCDDERDMQNWFNYLWAAEGLFRPDSFADRTNYQNVDVVVLTNLYYKHNRFFEKKVRDSWSLEHSFNIISSNPARLLDKGPAIQHFIKLLPNLSEEFANYVVPGEVPDYVKDSVKIPWFVKDIVEKEKGIYLFSEKEPDKPDDKKDATVKNTAN